MKKLFTILLLSLTLPFAALASEFEQGKHYDVIANPNSSAKPEVVEFFSFYCPHCANFEPIAQQLEQQLPAGSSFTKMHVDFMRAAPAELQNNLARAFLAADRQGKKHQVIDAIFQHIHGKRESFTSPDQIRQVAIDAGADASAYDADINSFAVINAADFMKQQQNKYTAQGVLSGVPMLIVNGKYKINFQHLEGDFAAELTKLVNYLLEK
ncbi:thiol:disulfide interchange protein DsbA/DsbL [Rheinheimera salexigens]|uniref:Thiol:disulfide interchange protein n=1 Tax=Rheinheimera salexigens TaxID=1628148 RepID=A0A1E7Q2C1_9GAMM|nr:thiol:disulfide interchange protein DsbA/DsbL [Rheinheimera salexigens]OEY68354.1 hypothetical protein BI198_01300 [Rheinheimera salexigens]